MNNLHIDEAAIYSRIPGEFVNNLHTDEAAIYSRIPRGFVNSYLEDG